MRSVLAIEARLAIARSRVAKLEGLLIAARQQELDAMVAQFRAGKSFLEIAREFGRTKMAVQGVLFRAGWTMQSRQNIPARARQHAHPGELQEAVS